MDETSQSKKVDPFAWIVLSLPRKKWFQGQIIVEKLNEKVKWNEKSGEITIRHSGEILKGSNIQNIVRHVLDDKTPEPEGYSIVVQYLRNDVSNIPERSGNNVYVTTKKSQPPKKKLRRENSSFIAKRSKWVTTKKYV